MESKYTKKSLFTGIVSFLIVLFSMPLGHALMVLMETFLHGSGMFRAAFIMGAAGLTMTIKGIFARGNTRQTLWGLFGGLLFWTGWVEFIYVYYAERFGVKPLIDAAGKVVTRPEYLILPSSFGFWVMFMVLYLFNAKTGCDFLNWLQKVFFRNSRVSIKLHPMSTYPAITTFMEVNSILWTCYLLLLFCYDDHFLGIHHPVTIIVAFGSLIGSLFMIRHLLKINTWGYALRYAIATVIIFWNFVEVSGKWNFYKEIWIHPTLYKKEMITLFSVFVILLAVLLYLSSQKKKNKQL